MIYKLDLTNIKTDKMPIVLDVDKRQMKGSAWTEEARIIAALVQRLGGKVELTQAEVLPPRGLILNNGEDDTIKVSVDRKFMPRDQVIYAPAHAKGDTNHSDCEEGFIMGPTGNPETFFVRYFLKYPRIGLRTIANSEATNGRDLVLHKHHDQKDIDKLYEHIQLGQEGKLMSFWEDK